MHMNVRGLFVFVRPCCPVVPCPFVHLCACLFFLLLLGSMLARELTHGRYPVRAPAHVLRVSVVVWWVDGRLGATVGVAVRHTCV
jgi:hypothetical protein